MTEHVKAIRKIAPSYAGMIKALVQLSAEQEIQSNQGLVGKLIDLIQRLKQSFINAKAKDIANEQQLIDDYNDLIGTLDDQINGYKAEINNLQGQILSQQNQLVAAENDRDTAENTMTTTSTLL